LRAHASATIGLDASEEVDTSETGSPVWGSGGNHLNDAAGGAPRATGGDVRGGEAIVNVTGSLLPAGPSAIELAWSATAVYWPLDRAGLALSDVQPAPVPTAVAVETIGSVTLVPAWI
jgi:hypothetical protein